MIPRRRWFAECRDPQGRIAWTSLPRDTLAEVMSLCRFANSEDNPCPYQHLSLRRWTTKPLAR